MPIRLIMLTTSLFVSGLAHAEFSEMVRGKVTYPSGRTESVNFELSFKQVFDKMYFRAGKSRIQTDEVPESYILNVIVNKDGLIYVAEFADGYINGFDVRVGSHHVSFKQRSQSDDERNEIGYENIEVSIDSSSYLLDTTHPTVMFEFDQNGIIGINGSGYNKNLSDHSLQR
ncbi:hypothetical protein [Idiomarina xiamenensis]|uniref:Uncharacterized protein n=1 Tax=Idiomarina xiamenensis 10-D-4 TaxID=740709 RepID=K2KCA3_9GAMM|nr:hypothetical protein [Idiomarina xiamenensis]EKE84247.1 hypothetical protein A10D4_06126 [Idiomarina xiamenensis 10-D-4]